MSWTHAIEANALTPGSAKVFKNGPHQVALLSSPLAERRIHRIAREAVAFVTQGKVPRSIM